MRQRIRGKGAVLVRVPQIFQSPFETISRDTKMVPKNEGRTIIMPGTAHTLQKFHFHMLFTQASFSTYSVSMHKPFLFRQGIIYTQIYERK